MSTPSRAPESLVAAVRADLDRWGIAEDTALAASALDLAVRLGESGIRPAAASMLHAQLRATLVELWKLARPAEDGDALDELQKRREQRRRA